MVKLILNADRIDDLRRVFALAPELTEAELFVAAKEADIYLQREVMDATPTAHGTLRASTFHEERISPEGVIGLVASPLRYVAPVEFGRRPGKQPPHAAIVDWVAVRFGLHGDAAERTAWVVARAIGRRGTKGAGMYERAFKAGGDFVGQCFERAIERVVRKLAAGGAA